MAKKKLDFEQAIARLEEIVDLLERSEDGLAEIVKLYKEGVELSVYCNTMLRNAESQVYELSRTAEGKFLEMELKFDNKDE